LFSDKFDFFVPPTLDKKVFLEYLNTVNTNNLNWWKTIFVSSINWLKKVLNNTNILVLLSDFDTDEDLLKIDIKNFVYPIWIGTNSSSVVKNKEWETLYNNWNIITSSLKKEKIKQLAKIKNTDYKIIDSYKKDEVLPFLKDIKSQNLIEKKQKVNYIEILAFILILLAL